MTAALKAVEEGQAACDHVNNSSRRKRRRAALLVITR
jgi:hypothetical protein